LENGNETPPIIDLEKFDVYLASHLVDPSLLCADSFEFHGGPTKRLLPLIEEATGKAAYAGNGPTLARH